MMDKIGFFLTVLICMFISCAENNRYTIEGSIDDGSLKKVYLLKSDSAGLVVYDTVEMNNGNFVFEGIIDKPEVWHISFQPPEIAEYLYGIILEPGKISVSFSPDREYMFAAGTPLNDKWRNAFGQYTEKKSELDHLLGKDSLSLAEIDLLEKTKKEMSGFVSGFIRENIDNEIGLHYLLSLRWRIDDKDASELLNLAGDTFRNLTQIKEWETFLAIKDNIKSGNPFIDVRGVDPDGNEKALSDYAGNSNIVLIDFWASWCAPCIDEFPRLKTAYERYKPRGFEIIGVSLDNDSKKWKASIEKLNLEWPQISDLKGWDSEFVRQYPARPIPYSVLLDENGNIIKAGLRGNMLLAILDKIYNK